MAIQRVDDLDGKSPVEEPTRFTFAGTTYSIDLGEANLAKLEELLSPYIEVATVENQTSMFRPTTPTARKPNTNPDLQLIRLWAQQQGMNVADRGRIKQEVVDAYNAAH